MNQKMMSINQILAQSPLDLVSWLDENFNKELPVLNSSVEFAQHNYLLGELANSFSFLTSLHAVAQIMVRDAKRRGLEKAYVDDCIDKRDVIESFLNAVKMNYTAFSRMITVQKQADDEMRMMQET